MSNRMESETLRTEVFGKQPNYYDLDFTKRVEKMLSQYSVNPEAAKAIRESRIPGLLSESVGLSTGTAQELAVLRAELIVSGGIGKYYSEPVARIEEKNREQIASILAGTAPATSVNTATA